jgi:hypothetical protein
MNVTRIKGFFHAFQAFLIFLAWALTIAVFTRDGATDGRTAWFFALVGYLLLLSSFASGTFYPQASIC